MKVLIVGAGIGGLTLANFLKKAGIAFEVFERDQEVDARPQGYALGLKDPGGISVLKQLGMLNAAEAAGRPTTGFSFVTNRGKRLMVLRASQPGAPGYTLGVPRTKLRQILLDGLGSLNIHYGKQCSGYQNLGSGAQLLLSDGQKIEGDIIVACDGVRSSIRRQLVGDSLHFLGLSSIGAAIEADSDHPFLQDNAFMMLGPGKSVFAQKFAKDDKAVWSFCFHTGEEELHGVGSERLKEMVVTETAGWAAPVPELVSRTPANLIASRPYYDREPLETASDGRVILLGDACHPMSPFQGQGANCAMLDAHDLSKELAAMGSRSLEECLKSFEKKMLERSKPLVLQSRNYAERFHTTKLVSRLFRDWTFRAVNLLLLFARPRRST